MLWFELLIILCCELFVLCDGLFDVLVCVVCVVYVVDDMMLFECVIDEYLFGCDYLNVLVCGILEIIEVCFDSLFLGMMIEYDMLCIVCD